MSTEVLNANLRPLTIYMLVALVGLFFLALMGIMLWRYAMHGEIDWMGLTAFLGFVGTFLFQHCQNRHEIKRIDATARAANALPGGGLVNPAALA